ncbi:MAG: c-type cytochrome [Nitrospiria bacterium]
MSGTVIPRAEAQETSAAQQIYEKRCSGCHGIEGKGDGPASERLVPKPRDFTSGLYKYKTTPFGVPPTDDDLFKVISGGLPGTAMPAWNQTLKENEIRGVIGYIKTFSKTFETQKIEIQPIAFSKEPAPSKESIERGKDLFHAKATCFMCHGQEGRGDGVLLSILKDAANNPVRPRNLTKGWFFRGGHTRKDIYTRINTGIAGTPMPSFADKLSEEEKWSIVSYVYSLSPETRPELKPVIMARRVAGILPDDPNDPRWNDIKSLKFPLLGQVIREQRLFAPSIEEVDVEALYNDQEIALLLIWDDPTESKANPAMNVNDDGFAVQFPTLVKSDQKPYFLRGDEQNSVYLWVWTADGKIQEMNASGLDKVVPHSPEGKTLAGKAVYKNGQYRLVFKRTLATQDRKNALQFETKKFIPISFSAWNGSNGEGGTKFSLSAWYYLFLEPPASTNIYIYPTIFAILVIGVEIWLVRKGRNDKGG